jgi:hypothetical protein
MDTQGKPYFSLPGFVPILDLLMIILCAIISIVGMTTLCLLPRLHHPLWEWDAFNRATHDKFFVVIEANDPALQRTGTRRAAPRDRRHEPHLHRRRAMKLRYFASPCPGVGHRRLDRRFSRPSLQPNRPSRFFPT